MIENNETLIEVGLAGNRINLSYLNKIKDILQRNKNEID